MRYVIATILAIALLVLAGCGGEAPADDQANDNGTVDGGANELPPDLPPPPPPPGVVADDSGE